MVIIAVEKRFDMSNTNPANIHKVSVARIKKEMKDTVYLSDDLVIASLVPSQNPSAEYPVVLDGFTALIIMSGEATIAVDTRNYEVGRNMIVILSPHSVVKTLKCSANASAYVLSFSKSFVDNVQIDISTSLPVYMRFGKNPCLQVSQRDVDEIRQVFQLIKTMIQSDKEQYRNEIIRSLFVSAFYIITDLNQRGISTEYRQGRCEILFEQFMELLGRYNKQERNVSFYARLMNITPKYLSSVVKEVSGKTAARWIDESVILEAKTLLKYSGMSIQEIAYHLNFSTQSFFGKYFKQHTGISPSRFKRRG